MKANITDPYVLNIHMVRFPCVMQVRLKHTTSTFTLRMFRQVIRVS